MLLSQLISALQVVSDTVVLQDFEVKGIASHSREVGRDFVFVAIPGTTMDGSRFIEEAISSGARAVVVQSPYGGKALRARWPVVEVKDARLALAQLAGVFYGHPSSQIKVLGITGTNGKTTITYLIEALCKEAKKKAGVIGTVNYRFAGRSMPSKNTTPGAVELQAMLRAMAQEGTEYVAMEVSSHALAQDRTQGIEFRYALFTNLTQDHLDYHQGMEGYFLAKAKLFQGLKSEAVSIINIDDPYGRRLLNMTPSRIVTYAIEAPADIVAADIRYDITYTEFLLRGLGNKCKVRSALIGTHNVYNILGACACAIREGFAPEAIESAVAAFACVPGRLQRIETRKGFFVFVDYAHTEDALRNAITSLRRVSRGRIITVFGCGGDRDTSKRPKMGRAAAQLADYCIITSDNPRSEDPHAIIRDISAGISKDNYCVIVDRFEAIKKSLTLAEPNDVVLIAGKGHEDYQVLLDRKIHFDDCEVVRACLESMN